MHKQQRLPVIVPVNGQQTWPTNIFPVSASRNEDFQRMIDTKSNILDFPEIPGNAQSFRSPRKFSASDLYAIDETSSSWLE